MPLHPHKSIYPLRALRHLRASAFSPSFLTTSALTLLILIPACSVPKILEPVNQPGPAALSQDSPPPDFALGITVYSPLIRPEQVQPAPRVLRPSRYILEADGILRAAIGPGARQTAFPPQTRQLSPAQVTALWAAVRDSGLVDDALENQIPSAETYEPIALALAEGLDEQSPGVTTAVIYLSQNGHRRWSAVTLAGPGVEVDPLATLSARQLIERLARLAWLK